MKHEKNPLPESTPWQADGAVSIVEIPSNFNERKQERISNLLNQVTNEKNYPIGIRCLLAEECSDLRAILYSESINLPALAWSIHYLMKALSLEGFDYSGGNDELLEQVKELDQEFECYRRLDPTRSEPIYVEPIMSKYNDAKP